MSKELQIGQPRAGIPVYTNTVLGNLECYGVIPVMSPKGGCMLVPVIVSSSNCCGRTFIRPFTQHPVPENGIKGSRVLGMIPPEELWKVLTGSDIDIPSESFWLIKEESLEDTGH